MQNKTEFVPLEFGLKSFIVCYIEDYDKLPTVKVIRDTFDVSEQRAFDALAKYGNLGD